MKTLATIAALLFPLSLLASADLVTTTAQGTPTIRSGYASAVYYTVKNNGPDVAPGVKVSVSSEVATTCSCDFGDIPPGQSRTGSASFVAPATNATFTVTMTATSTATDPNPADNIATATVTVSADPDLGIGVGV